MKGWGLGTKERRKVRRRVKGEDVGCVTQEHPRTVGWSKLMVMCSSGGSDEERM